ncbi:mycofactocin system transcriptional regulator [Microbacterium immunditiarum]|uniref:Mycofactocin system transcriptional regulator n=1 Tax=Microbacterium immunditiarum TaxID=337480 RepID=A0A7Y9KJU9_9MICO|nr:mycofactocin system transcriptional regulator [Microbacterium immunditiarum]NYE18144.1 mycofactocin system transcriptional regulator [Microbacterium immunditiarum]
MTLEADRLEADARAAAPDAQRARMGRAPVTTHGELSHLALALFLERGFDKTTVDDIVRAAGIGRRTFFRYFASKNDLPWGDFERLLNEMREHLAGVPDDVPLMEALRAAVVDFNRFPGEELRFHRERMWLLLNVPSLVAHSTLRYAAWRRVIAEYVAGRLDVQVDSLAPQAIAWSCLGLCLAAYEQWLAHDDVDLLELLDASFRRLADAHTSAA